LPTAPNACEKLIDLATASATRIVVMGARRRTTRWAQSPASLSPNSAPWYRCALAYMIVGVASDHLAAWPGMGLRPRVHGLGEMRLSVMLRRDARSFTYSS